MPALNLLNLYHTICKMIAVPAINFLMKGSRLFTVCTSVAAVIFLFPATPRLQIVMQHFSGATFLYIENEFRFRDC